jgi:hypothetical protein
MSVDDRLRDALREQADAFVPQVELALDRVRARGRLQRWRAGSVAVAASAVLVAAVAGVLVALDSAPQPDAPPVGPATTSASGDATPPPQGRLRGTMAADVDQPAALAGRWTLQLNGNGTIDVSTPKDFRGEASSPFFTADTSSFRTTLFDGGTCRGTGTGIYSWLRVADRIEFQPVSDTCVARARFFADSTWRLSTRTPGGD